MKITGINHIGIIAKDQAKATDFFSILGLQHLATEIVADQKVKTDIFSTSDTKGRLELLLPEPHREGPIARYIESRGTGIHHIALTVDNLTSALRELSEKGIELIDKIPRKGAHNTMIAFIHPKSTGGILIELVQE